MEEFDDLLQKPDDNGVLDMSHRAWVTLDETIWTWGATLMVLDISYNEVKFIPPGIGELGLLREFNCASNHLQILPPDLGRCSRLKLLKCNGNRLDTLPTELSKCRQLMTVIASENTIMELPSTIGELPVLQTLDLQNNRLRTLPHELADCLALETLDVTGNPDLAMIPETLRDNTKLILWICRQNQIHTHKVDDLEKANNELEALAKLYDDQKLEMKDEIVKLRKENKKLVAEHPVTYMKVKRAFTGCGSRVCTIM